MTNAHVERTECHHPDCSSFRSRESFRSAKNHINNHLKTLSTECVYTLCKPLCNKWKILPCPRCKQAVKITGQKDTNHITFPAYFYKHGRQSTTCTHSVQLFDEPNSLSIQDALHEADAEHESPSEHSDPDSDQSENADSYPSSQAEQDDVPHLVDSSDDEEDHNEEDANESVNEEAANEDPASQNEDAANLLSSQLSTPPPNCAICRLATDHQRISFNSCPHVFHPRCCTDPDSNATLEICPICTPPNSNNNPSALRNSWLTRFAVIRHTLRIPPNLPLQSFCNRAEPETFSHIYIPLLRIFRGSNIRREWSPFTERIRELHSIFRNNLNNVIDALSPSQSQEVTYFFNEPNSYLQDILQDALLNPCAQEIGQDAFHALRMDLHNALPQPQTRRNTTTPQTLPIPPSPTPPPLQSSSHTNNLNNLAIKAGATWQYVPKIAEKAFIQSSKQALLQYRSASRRDNDEAKTLAIFEILGLPGKILKKVRGGRRGARQLRYNIETYLREMAQIEHLSDIDFPADLAIADPRLDDDRGEDEQEVANAEDPADQRHRTALDVPEAAPSPQEAIEEDEQEVANAEDPADQRHRTALDVPEAAPSPQEAITANDQASPNQPHPQSYEAVPPDRAHYVPDRSPLDYMIDKAIALAKRGHAARAMQNLLRKPIGDMNQRKLDKLRSLHPRNPNSNMPQVPENCPFQVPDKEIVAKLCRKLDNGASPGPSAWTGAMLKTIARDTDCLSGLTQLVGDIINNNIPPQARDALLQCNLLGIDKPRDPDSIRPIAIGEIFYKVAALHQLEAVRDELGPLFEPIQLAICCPNGMEKAFHVLQSKLEAGGPDVAALLVDLKNAFNTEDRASMLRALYERDDLKALWNIAGFAYGNGPRSLIVHMANGTIERINSEQGTCQGDTLGLLLFCLSKHQTFINCTEGLESTVARAYADDFTCVGPTQEIIVALQRIATADNVNFNKTKILWPHDTAIPQALQDAADEFHVAIVLRSATLYGGLLTKPSANGDLISQHLHDVVAKHQPAFDILSNPKLPKQICLYLLRVCIQPRMTFHARTTQPEFAQSALRVFDEKVLDILLDRILLFPHETRATLHDAIRHYGTATYDQLAPFFQLPHRHGGLGIRLSQDISYPGYFASSVAAAAEVDQLFDSPERLQESVVFQHRESTLQELQARGALTSQDPSFGASVQHRNRREKEFLPQTAANITQFYNDLLPGTSLQHLLTAQLESRAYKALREHLPRRDKMRLESTTAKAASSWLTTLPQGDWSWFPSISDEDFTVALRLRLGFPASLLCKTTCACGQNLTGPHADPCHFMACPKFKRRSVTHRHNSVNDFFAKICTFVFMQSEREPLRIHDPELGQGRRHPDLHTYDIHTGRSLLCDVKVKNCSCPTGLARNLPVKALLCEAANDKIAKYAEYARLAQADFLPLVFDAFGTMHVQVFSFIRKLIGAGVFNHAINHDEALTFLPILYAAVGSCLQIGNARIMRSGTLCAR